MFYVNISASKTLRRRLNTMAARRRLITRQSFIHPSVRPARILIFIARNSANISFRRRILFLEGMTHLQSVNAAAGGRALAARQIDQVQPAAGALSNVLLCGGRDAVTVRGTLGIGRDLFPREINGQ